MFTKKIIIKFINITYYYTHKKIIYIYNLIYKIIVT